MKSLPLNYFRHDASASQDSRLLRLRAKHGYEGIGVYWHVIETLYLNEGAMEEESVLSLFDRNTNVIHYCVEVGLLVSRDGMYFSERLKEEISNRVKKSVKARASIQKRWLGKGKKPKDTNVSKTNIRKGYERNTRRGEEKREEDSSINQDVATPETYVSPTVVDEDAICARTLFGYLRQTNPAFAQKHLAESPKQIRLWADSFRLMREIDKATHDQIMGVMRWLFESEHKDAQWWRGNIRSGEKFREQFIRLVSIIQRSAAPKSIIRQL